jgi:hypothetical protein
MAAAVITNRKRVVIGSENMITATVVANNTDTWITGLKKILAASFEATTNSSIGFTISGGTITFASGGSLTLSGIVMGH